MILGLQIINQVILIHGHFFKKIEFRRPRFCLPTTFVVLQFHLSPAEAFWAASSPARGLHGTSGACAIPSDYLLPQPYWLGRMLHWHQVK